MDGLLGLAARGIPFGQGEIAYRITGMTLGKGRPPLQCSPGQAPARSASVRRYRAADPPPRRLCPAASATLLGFGGPGIHPTSTATSQAPLPCPNAPCPHAYAAVLGALRR